MAAASAGEVLSQIADAQRTGEKFSTIVLETDLPSPGGLALAATLRASPAAGVPVILVHSHLLTEEERDRCEQLGVTQTISKPFRRSALLEALRASHGEVDQAQIPEPEKIAGQRRPSLRILLAEDNLVNQRLISRHSRKWGTTLRLQPMGKWRCAC